MKSTIYFAIASLFSLLVLPVASFAQFDTLLIEGSRHSIYLVEGEEINVKTTDFKVKGTLSFLNDSTIRVGAETIELSQLVWIRARGATGRRITAVVLTSLGVTAIAGAGAYAVVIYNRSYGGFLGGLQAWTDRLIATSIGSLGTIVATSGVLILRDKKYKTGKYSYSIQ